MPVKKDPSGRRSVQTEVEVPGTPEEVWRAIATGPGISSWFVPTQVEEREGGKITACFGPNMDSESKVTSWNPPHRFTAESPSDCGPEGPTIATEWTIQARAGGSCVVRVVHSWFTDSDAWDDQYEETQYGWTVFFRLLRHYLTHFKDQHGSVVQLTATQPAPKDQAWATLCSALGFGTLAEGEPIRTGASAPRLAGKVIRVGEPVHPEDLMLHLEEPAPGYAHLIAMPMAGHVLLPMRFFWFGNGAAEIARKQEAAWQAWIRERLAQ